MRRLLSVFLLACLLGSAASARADEGDDPAPAAEDTVVLQNGSVWTGRIIEEDDTSVTLERVSPTGGVGRLTFPRKEIELVRRGTPRSEAARGGGPRLIRNEWFLLRSSGRIVGTRHLQLWSVKSRGLPGYRLEENVAFFAQGPHLPGTSTQRVEEVDLRFFPRLLAWRESGDGSDLADGPKRYTRNVSGRVVDGLWLGSAFRDGQAHRCELSVPTGARGRLGLREHLLRIPRRVRLLDARVIEPQLERLVGVRAGFASVTQDPSGRRPGHEFHWEESGLRLISWFDKEQGALEEQVSEGIVAIPVSQEQVEAAVAEADRSGDAETSREVGLAEAGIAFTVPGPIWAWKPAPSSPGNTGWRVLGRLSHSVLLSDVRIELHPVPGGVDRAPDATQAWLLRRLRGASPDAQVVVARRALPNVPGGWQIGLQGTLKRESVRTIAAVVDRPTGRVVLLLACPAGAWEQVRQAFDRFLDSLRAL